MGRRKRNAGVQMGATPRLDLAAQRLNGKPCRIRWRRPLGPIEAPQRPRYGHALAIKDRLVNDH